MAAVTYYAYSARIQLSRFVLVSVQTAACLSSARLAGSYQQLVGADLGRLGVSGTDPSSLGLPEA